MIYGLRTNIGGNLLPNNYPASSPNVPSVPDVQTTLPTSAYGQTIPVVWGKCRLPAAYIWVPPILTVTSSHVITSVDVWRTVTSTTAKMSARLRFARPLVPNSTWTMRKFYADGKLIYDGSSNYRQSGLKFTAYDGRSTQPRDPTMISEEGETNISAHRGYLDIVVKDFDIAGLGAPPVFEAEWIQDGATTHHYDTFSNFGGRIEYDKVVVDWDSGVIYGYNPYRLSWYSLYTKAEFFSVADASPYNYAFTLRYSPLLGKIVFLGSGAGLTSHAVIMDPSTGIHVADSIDTQSGVPTGGCLVDIGSGAILVGFSSTQQIYAFHLTLSVSELSFASTVSWDGYASIQCVTAGEIRGSEADFWFCADTDLVKVTLTAQGTFKSSTVVATLADDLRYAVYDDGDLVVWTDAATVKRINGTTGAVEFTETVPYQIETVGTSRGMLADPDLHRFVGELYFTIAGISYFTNLGTGKTRSISGASADHYITIYDGENNVAITKTSANVPVLVRISEGDGSVRALEDLLTDLMVYGGDYDPSQVDTFNIDDLIQGGVFDVTAGARDVARAIAEPYSIAIFERSGQVIFKRAFTDGALAIDATLSSSGDIADSGGQAVKAKRYNPEEFISRYGINYRDPDQIYQERPQFGEIPSLPLPVAPADQSVKANIPIIVDADTVKVLATQKVNRLAIERHEFMMTLRAKYADLEPEDVVRFTFASRLITARVTEVTLRPDYMIDIVATEFLTSVSVSISGAIGQPTEPDPVGTPESRYYHLDIPLLSDADDAAGAGLVQYHVLASVGQPYWDGATLFRRDTLGLYQPVAEQVTNGLVGIALDVLPDWDVPYVTEFSRAFDLVIISGDTDLLVSVTYLQMMNGANYFAIGQPGRWEVCQVMTITSNGAGNYTFEGLRRGKGSSEEYTGLHEIGDFVIWLSEDNVQHIDYAIASLDEAFDFKPVGLGGSISTTTAVNRTVTGEAEKIPKPCQLDASIDSPSDVRLSWVRRTRVGSYWSDDGDYTAPLAETLEQYVVRIKSGPGGTILRTVTVNDATHYDYSGALQITDFGSPLTSGGLLTFDIRQVSGTGVICPTREATVTI